MSDDKIERIKPVALPDRGKLTLAAPLSDAYRAAVRDLSNVMKPTEQDAHGPNWTGTPLEAMAQVLMAATGPDGVPVLCLDPDFNELPDLAHMLDEDDYCREDIEALAEAALAEGERYALLKVRSFITKHGTKEVADYCAQRLHDIQMDARPKPNLGHSIDPETKK